MLKTALEDFLPTTVMMPRVGHLKGGLVGQVGGEEGVCYFMQLGGESDGEQSDIRLFSLQDGDVEKEVILFRLK